MTRKIQHNRIIPTPRDLEMYGMSKIGHTFHDIGLCYGISRERVRQIFYKVFGMTAKDCAKYKNSTANKIETALLDRKIKKDRKGDRCSRLFGCSEDVLISINGKMFSTSNFDYSSIAGKYLTQKNSAKGRGIGWNITLPEWWNIWQESGKYHLRGRGHGYAMARHGDSGAYEVGNVYICTGAQNTADQYLVRTHHWAKKHSQVAAA